MESFAWRSLWSWVQRQLAYFNERLAVERKKWIKPESFILTDSMGVRLPQVSRPPATLVPMGTVQEMNEKLIVTVPQFAAPNGERQFNEQLMQYRVNVRDAITRAQEKGWRTIKVSGESELRRAAWMEAQLAKVDLEGYIPTLADKARMESEAKLRGRVAEITGPPLRQTRERTKHQEMRLKYRLR